MRRVIIALALASLCLCGTPAVSAQVPNEGLLNSILAARRQNAATMRQYNWNSRTELFDNGNVKDIRIELVNYGPDGSLLRALLNDENSGHVPRGFFRKRIAEEKKKEAEEYLIGVRARFDQYTLPSAGKVLDFISQATVQTIPPPEGKPLLQMTGAGVVVPGDTFTLTLDAATMNTRRVQIATFYNGDTVNDTATCDTSKSGLNLQYADVHLPDKNMSIQIQNFDYEPND